MASRSLDLIPVAQRCGKPANWRRLGPAAALVLVFAWLGIPSSDPSPWSPLPVFSFMLSSFAVLLPEIARGAWQWVAASGYLLIFWRWMKNDARLDPPRVPLIFVIMMGALAVLNFVALFSESGWPASSGSPLRDYWLVSVAPPLLLFVYGLTILKEWRFRARLRYYTLCFAWIGFGNFPMTGELP